MLRKPPYVLIYKKPRNASSLNLALCSWFRCNPYYNKTSVRHFHITPIGGFHKIKDSSVTANMYGYLYGLQKLNDFQMLSIRPAEHKITDSV